MTSNASEKHWLKIRMNLGRVMYGVPGIREAKGVKTAEQTSAEISAAEQVSEKASTAKLQPYGGPGGGHHVPAKSAFEGAPGYNPNQALAIPNTELAKLGVDHGVVSVAQRTLYNNFAKTGKPLTWNVVKSIEANALIKGGMKAEQATATVNQAVKSLVKSGVSSPTRIPWSK
jgi:hypothetical protein